MSQPRQATLLLAALLFLAALPARAQLVNDGTTNVLSGVTSNLTGMITIGSNAPNTLLILSNGTQLTSSGGDYVSVGLGYSSTNSGVWVTGPGTSWVMSNRYYVGAGGINSLLLISNGGQVINQGLSGIGHDGGFSTATVTGTGSLWSNQTLRVGYYGGTNQLIISEGGRVLTQTTTAGGLGVSTGNRILVTGAGSVLSNATELLLGENGGENSLHITDGGTVYSALGNVGGYGGPWGAAGGAESNRVLIDGAGSSWVANRFSLGVASRGNDMLLTNGGTLRVLDSGLILGEYGYFSPSNNLLTISGGNLIVTNAARTNTYDIRWGTNLFNSGYMEVDNLVVTNAAGAFVFNGGTLVTRSAIISNGQDFAVGDVTGFLPAVWDVQSNTTATMLANGLSVGIHSGNGALLVTNGATLCVGQTAEGWDFATRVGVNLSATNNRAIVSGPNSLWTNRAGLIIGANGSFNSLLITNAGRVESTYSIVGWYNAKNNQATVTGANSMWVNSGGLVIGNFGFSNAVLVADGGTVLSAWGRIGAGADIFNPGVGNGNKVTVTGVGSLWNNSGELEVGKDSSFNHLLIDAGGNVVSHTGHIGIGGRLLDQLLGVSNQVTVAGANSLWVNQGELRVGINGWFNKLLIRDGGTVQTESMVIGVYAATNNGMQLDNGMLTASAGLTVNNHNYLMGSGMIIGTVTNFGAITPGNSAGAIAIHGDLRLRDSASLVFEIGGLLPTNQYDVVTVTNFVEFAGTLSLSLLPGFLPEAADSFALMSFASSSGAFANVSAGRVSLTNNLASFAVTLGATNLVLSGVQYVDTDGDGQGDLQEQAAGTDAADPASALAILSVTLNGAGHSVVRFQSVPGQSYRVEYSDNFATWSAATGAVFTNPLPGVSEWVDDGTLTGGLPATSRAYRIGLQ